jgi:amino acid transporter
MQINSNMIQRIQSVYLFVVILSNILAAIFLGNKLDKMASFIEAFKLEYVIFFVLITLLSLWGLLTFKKRGFQLKVGRLNLFLNFVALGFLTYWLLILPGEIDFSKKGIGLIIPIISIVFIVLAQKAIKRDDELVKSADRFR